MARVNPPPHIKIPKSLTTNKDLISVIDQLNFNLFQLWKRTGGADDYVNEALTGLYEFDDLIKLNNLDSLKSDVVVTSDNYETIGDQIIICSGINQTITLNPSPDDQELARIHSIEGRVNISGGGKNIMGHADAIIRRKYTTWDIMYILESDEWIII